MSRPSLLDRWRRRVSRQTAHAGVVGRLGGVNARVQLGGARYPHQLLAHVAVHDLVLLPQEQHFVQLFLPTNAQQQQQQQQQH